MTELEKEAEAFVSEKADKGNFDVEKFGKAYFSESSMKQALVKFAEPREKRIAELKKELKDANEKVVHLACNQNKDLKYKLTKAKEIIKELVENFGTDYRAKGKAKQFLKEIEKC